MSSGPCYIYYTCPDCGKRFKYSIDMIPVFGEDFGRCPSCHRVCTLEREGAVTTDDLRYEEVQD